MGGLTTGARPVEGHGGPVRPPQRMGDAGPRYFVARPGCRPVEWGLHEPIEVVGHDMVHWVRVLEEMERSLEDRASYCLMG